jgi:hypothetical protein
LRSTGPAQRPVLRAFSTATMKRSQAPSHPLTGKPLSRCGAAGQHAALAA